jgi:signal transduction histidine kinase
MIVATPWRALRTSPLRLFASATPWRSLAYLATGVPSGLAALLLLPPLVFTGVGPVVAGVALAAVERRRLRLIDVRPAPSPHRSPSRPGALGWLAIRLREPATWQELAFAVLAGVALWAIDLLTVWFAFCLTVLPLSAPLLVAVLPAQAVPNGVRLRDIGAIWLLPLAGAAFAVVMGYVVTAVAAARAALVRALLVPAENAGLVEVTRSRARMMASFDSERRRIERDLHDGVQQRLLGLSVTLALARMEHAADDRSEVDRLLARAHEESKAVLEQLRDLVRGIHPWLLTDRGLAAAIADLAGRCALPVDTEIQLDGRLPLQAESVAYFVISEALTNVDRHSGARQVTVTVQHDGAVLTVEVRDDGRGGANPARGTGLQGLADRAGAADGRLLVSSPPGGPTVLRLEVPCQRHCG